jgi:hypothetical protein
MLNNKNRTSSYGINSQTYYDCYNECYKNILIINKHPDGPLSTIVKRLQTPKLSPFQESSSCCPIKNCALALYKIDNNCELMTPDDIPDLYNFLISNDYKIDTSITKMMNSSDVKMTNKLVCFITY